MEETPDVESATIVQSVKRKDVMKRSAAVLFSSFAAIGAVESLPLPADAQHVIGFAMIARKVALSASKFLKTKAVRTAALPTAQTMGGFAFVALDAAPPPVSSTPSGNPFSDSTGKYQELAYAELSFIMKGNLSIQAMYYIASTEVDSTNLPMSASFGFDGQMIRFAQRNTDDGSNGSPSTYDNAGAKAPRSIWLVVLAP